MREVAANALRDRLTLVLGQEPSEDLRAELVKTVRTQIGPIATPDLIQWAPSLPKTRSGKIMRRILRKIAANEHDQLGDTTTLADPSPARWGLKWSTPQSPFEKRLIETPVDTTESINCCHAP